MISMPPQVAPAIPARVSAAMQYIQMMHYKGDGIPGLNGSRSPSGTISTSERVTYDSAVRMLNQYFSGEMDFGDLPPRSHESPPDDGTEKETANVS